MATPEDVKLNPESNPDLPTKVLNHLEEAKHYQKDMEGFLNECAVNMSKMSIDELSDLRQKAEDIGLEEQMNRAITAMLQRARMNHYRPM